MISAPDVALRVPALLRANWLPIELPIPGPAERGRFATVVDDAIENALADRGCARAARSATSDLDSTLNDQLHRARLAGLGGLCVIVPPLQGMTNSAGVLDAEDSAVLRWWLQSTDGRPLALWLDDANRYLGVYGPPVPLHRLLAREAEQTEVGLVRRPGLSTRASGCRPGLDGNSRVSSTSEPDVGATLGPCEQAASVTQEAVQVPLPSAAEERSSVEHDPERAVTSADPGEIPPPSEPNRVPGSSDGGGDLQDTPHEDSEAVAATPSPSNQSASDDLAPQDEPEESGAWAALSAPAARICEAPPMFPKAGQDWRNWVRELEASRGPKPLSVIERLFTNAYCPLREAVARGIAPESATDVADHWAASFARSYAEAFDSLRLRGRRPSMVLDLPDIALRTARLHGARAFQLVLVDAMRFDVGLRVHHYLERAVGDAAMLTERLLCWSALPSTSSVQLELIGRGADGLRDRSSAPDTDVSVARGRAAQTLRRTKAGSRELLKLDVVESALRERGPALLERLDSLAAAAAGPLGDYLLELPPRTLVMVFGDHGFVVDCDDCGTSAARHGGASPDEVLVPAFAWLTGAMH